MSDVRNASDLTFWHRLMLGFLLSPIVPGIVFCIVGVAIGGNAHDVPGLLMLSAVIAYPAALVLGVPAFFTLRLLRLNHIAYYVLAGASMGLLVFFFLVPIDNQTKYFFQNGWFFLMIAVGSAVIAAGTFWLIARPDTHAN